MIKVRREDIVDYETYNEQRAEFQKEVFVAKAARRIHVGDHFTFLFENTLTIRYQVQEMMRTERIVKERDIEHEISTYNALLGEPGELGCTLLIEIDDPQVRARRLKEWLRLPLHIYARLEDGTKVRARFDAAQIGEEQVSSVQYLKFQIGSRPPVALGIDLPGIEIEAELAPYHKEALAADLL